jgi:hypothetical protein
MLQRIQTIWLLLAAACAFAGLKFSFYTGILLDGMPAKQVDPATGTITSTTNIALLNGFSNLYLAVLTIAIGVLALITIFLYKTRKLQLRLIILGILLQGLLIFLYYREVKSFASGTLSLTGIMQVLIVVFFFLAARGVRRDENIIKESNRLR